MTYNYVAIIPARIGSKGIPKKNIRLLGTTPLIHFTIDAAINSGVFSEIIVSTESIEITDIVYSRYDKNAVTVMPRPDDLALDWVQNDDVCHHVIRRLSSENQLSQFTHGVLLQPTSPFRNHNHIRGAVELAERTGNTVISGKQLGHAFYWTLSEDESVQPIDHNPMQRYGRQWSSNPTLYQEDGAIYIFDIEKFMHMRAIRIPPISGYVIPEQFSLDLDTMQDWNLAQEMMTNDINRVRTNR